MANPYYYAGSGYPVVVQGQPVSNVGYALDGNVSSHYNNHQSPSSYHVGTGTATDGVGMDSSWLPMENGQRGTPQPKRCRDAFWGILFYAQVAAIMCLAGIYTPQMAKVLATKSSSSSGRRLAFAVSSWRSIHFQDMPTHFHRFLQESSSSSSTGNVSFNIREILLVLSISGLLGLVMSSFALVFMMKFAAGLIKAALISHVLFMVALAVLALLAGSTGICILLFIGAGLSLCFTVGAWSRIPFGAANLTTAVTAVRANIGLTFFAYLSLCLSFAWSIVWSLSSVSTTFVLNECDSSFQCSKSSPLVLFLFLLSYHWTSQVIFNVVRVTTAGTVGTWWFAPQEANSCCSKAVGASYVRAMTWSFGSICLGSLLVALIEATRDLLRNLREQNDSMLACVADCFLSCIESWAEYFCKWAFVYVGLYGYGFVEASTNVINLFRTRGWTTIITDTLVDTVLFMVALSVGALTGVIALIVGFSLSGGLNSPVVIYFFIGFVVGWIMCATLFSIISSAVSTVIVCYAEAPNEFQANHPQLSEHMRAAWRQAWPVEFHY